MAWWSHKNTIINLDKVEQISFDETTLQVIIHFPTFDNETSQYFQASFETLEAYKKAKLEIIAKTYMMSFFDPPLSLDS